MESMNQTQALAQFEPAVYKYARQWHGYTRIRNEFELEDVAQIGRMYILHALEDFDPSNNMKLSSYIIQRIRWGLNYSLRSYMRAAKPITVSIDFMNEGHSDRWHPSEVTDPITFDLLLEDLPSELREVAKMRFLNDMTYREIGEKMGTSHEWARQLTKNALKIMEISE